MEGVEVLLWMPAARFNRGGRQIRPAVVLAGIAGKRRKLRIFTHLPGPIAFEELVEAHGITGAKNWAGETEPCHKNFAVGGYHKVLSQYDLIVIGSGPAGQRAAIQGAKSGKKVALVERREVIGGVCINTGTIPS